MEQVPHVAMYCHEEKDEHQRMHLVPSFLLPLVVRYLTDVNNQVRTSSGEPIGTVRSNLTSLILNRRCGKRRRRRCWFFWNRSWWLTTTSRTRCARSC